MNALAPCPDLQRLQAYQLGSLSGPDAAAVADHLRVCASCGAKLFDDSLALRPVEATDPQPNRGLAPEQLAETLELPAQKPPTGATSATTGPTLLPAAPYPFLLPPNKPNEIGRLGNFRVLRLLGEGGMGMVFQAEDITLRRRLALKVLRPELRGRPEILQRFILEARALAALKHENLVTIHQAGQENGTFYLAMELLVGESLSQWMARVGQAEVHDVLRLGREIAAGLAAIHRRRLVHRDLKPSNIWLEAPKGQVKILDFGLVQRVKDEAPLTQMGVILGTPTFMSPEQARGERVDARSDLFNLGIILYALCTGVKPFRGDTHLAVLTAIVADAPEDILELAPGIPRPLADLVMQLLAKKAEDRPAGADQVIELLQQIERTPSGPRRPQPAQGPVLSRTPKPAGPLPTLEHSVGPRRKRPTRPQQFSLPALLLSCLAALVLIAVVLGAASMLTLPSQDSPSQLAVVPPKASGKASAPATLTPKQRPKTASKTAVEPPPEPKPVVEPPLEPDAVRVYLSELKPIAAENWPTFKSIRVTQPPKIDRILVKGELSLHGIFMHPPPLLLGRYASASYKLDKKFASFHSTVSLLDGALPGCAPVFFAVHGDKQLLYESKPVAAQNDAQRVTVSVKGVDVLTLSVTVKGADVRGALAVWIEPALQE